MMRPARAPSHAELQQAARTGIDPHQMKAEITALWQVRDNGKSFATALEQHGHVLARNDKVPDVAPARAMKQANHAGVLSGDPRSRAMRATARTGRAPRRAQATTEGGPGRSTRKVSLECRDGGKTS
jgi:hypothetical protein